MRNTIYCIPLTTPQSCYRNAPRNKTPKIFPPKASLIKESVLATILSIVSLTEGERYGGTVRQIDPSLAPHSSWLMSCILILIPSSLVSKVSRFLNYIFILSCLSIEISSLYANIMLISINVALKLFTFHLKLNLSCSLKSAVEMFYS